MSVVTPKEIRHGLIMKRVQEHYDEALQYFPEEQIVGIFLQGSQNYDLDYEGSDVDTKLIVVPSFKDICLNRKPISTTHVRENNEHIDWKDVRKYVEEFRKQNLNFLEILFTVNDIKISKLKFP
jgi:predicted nucleotidyltransferase